VKQIVKWIKNLFTGPRWDLTVSYNTTWGDKDDKSYTVKKFKKLSDKHIKFIDNNGKSVEIRSTAGLHYRIEEL
jgi:hypothetical protein